MKFERCKVSNIYTMNLKNFYTMAQLKKNGKNDLLQGQSEKMET